MPFCNRCGEMFNKKTRHGRICFLCKAIYELQRIKGVKYNLLNKPTINEVLRLKAEKIKEDKKTFLKIWNCEQ